MINLFMDTASSNLLVGIYQNNKIIYENIKKNDNHLSERLLPMIDEAFLNSNLTPQQIDKIFVVNGPGSFTGIRIGVTVAKTFAWSLKKSIIPISELELMLTTTSPKKYKAAIIDARRDYVYARVQDNFGKCIIEDTYILIDELQFRLNNEIGLNNVEFISDDNFNFKTSKIKYNILEIIEKHSNDVLKSSHEVNPNYLKKTEAEEKLESK